MMELTLQMAREKKYDYVWLGVWEKNFVAQSFYKSWGFERFGEYVYPMEGAKDIDWLLKLPVK